jgi:hypothetical protein
MTGGLIKENIAESYPAIGGDVTFNSLAVIEINADGTHISITDAKAGLATYDYIKPIMPPYEDLPDDPLPTDIDEVDDQKSNVENRKIFVNGQLLIIRDGKIYTITGALVK